MNMVFALKCSSALSSWYLDDTGSSIQTGVADTYVAYKIGIRKVGPCTMMAVARLCRKWLEELRWKLGQARVFSPWFGTRISHPNAGEMTTSYYATYLQDTLQCLFWKLWSQKSDNKQDNDWIFFRCFFLLGCHRTWVFQTVTGVWRSFSLFSYFFWNRWLENLHV